jgi:hypothetical protein
MKCVTITLTALYNYGTCPVLRSTSLKKLICKLHTGNGMCTLERPDMTWETLVTPLDCVCLKAVEDRLKSDRTVNIVPLCVAVIMDCRRPLNNSRLDIKLDETL